MNEPGLGGVAQVENILTRARVAAEGGVLAHHAAISDDSRSRNLQARCSPESHAAYAQSAACFEQYPHMKACLRILVPVLEVVLRAVTWRRT